MKNVIYFDQGHYDNSIQQLEKAKHAYQSLLTSFNALEIFPIKSMTELSDLATGSVGYVKSRLTELVEPPKFGLFSISKKKAVEMLDIDLTSIPEMTAPCLPYAHEVRYLSLERAQVTINNADVEKLRNECTLAATSSKQVEVWRAHQDAAAALSKLKALTHTFQHLDSKSELSQFFQVTDEAVVPNAWFYQRHSYAFRNL